MKMPRAVIFDFDGVIVDSERIKFERLERILVREGLHLKKQDFDLLVGKKTGVFLKERFGKKLTPAQIKSIAETRRKDQLRHLKAYCKPTPGAKEFIRRLSGKGMRLCLATGTTLPIIRRALRLLGLTGIFDALVTGEEFASSKPNPEVYRLAIRKLRVPKKQILVIEDSAAGVLAAKRAGLRCAAIATTQRKKQLKQADIVVRSFTELIRILETSK